MVCTANDLSAWNDFPKGLRVLLLDEDTSSAADIKLKLEAMDYIVSTFFNENEAMSAISNKPESFHVAIVQVNTSNSEGRFKFLEAAKDLPTIMTSNIHCLSTMMKCIALGAVEFVRKPLSEDKLKNIWQHVVHKAFNAGGGILCDSLKPVKESVVSMLHLQLENGESKNENSENTENISLVNKNDNEQSEGSDKYPAPSTPQLKQGGRLLDDVNCQDNTNSLTEKESGEQDGESKFVDTTCDNSIGEQTLQDDQPQRPVETVVKEEHDSTDVSKTECIMYPQLHDKKVPKDSNGVVEKCYKVSGLHNSCGIKTNRKKMKVDWTPELHKKFVAAVEHLGLDQAIPSRILELMKVEGLTRHNVASHLQKYRMHKRHILPKEDDRRWPQLRDHMPRSYYPHKPIMAFPPYHSNPVLPAGPVYPVWGAPTYHPAGVQMWHPPGYPSWQQPESWHWNPYPGMAADAWGCPVMPPIDRYPQGSGVVNNSYMPQNSVDLHPAEEVIDKVVKEAISKPWLPLPLGLKPPSADSVLAELSRQGIYTIPPHINGSHLC
ncbi:two-component response regulator-like APRR2 isoform X1 [Mangifera indica]|uniref:two-component response regulator-like APRR2 isoform X1 n=2 Tax=Mangifera indica TaxID=29780 RepID=UPI001CFB1951|nr:two-component response regulator-like APRR2 isoform X1 [Mangifera indica]XP_044503670.1 two-component response regulator-like APRR2 isoform X1 [Mangifera indica]XP_044503671.1 two-component response regulator-like APRR2 isoform X1 [Mangifera indica]